MSNAQELDIQIGIAQVAVSKLKTLMYLLGHMVPWDKEQWDHDDLVIVNYQIGQIENTISMVFDYLDQADKALKADIIEKAIKTLYGEPVVMPETR